MNHINRDYKLFFCESCNGMRYSKRHIIKRLPNKAYTIIQDTCEVCNDVQQLEISDEKAENK